MSRNQGWPRESKAPHGSYTRYSAGCTCDECKRAKRDYMRGRRVVQRKRPSELDVPFTHGSRFGYEERACRCDKCGAAKAAEDRRYKLAKMRRTKSDS